jgi:lipopolysaccharide biosynthesis glycosyltransferase
MRIDKVYINTHRYDQILTKICIGSIRYWYPDIPIVLIIDHSNGLVQTKKMIEKWNISILNTGQQHYGWGFGKFEPLFLKNSEKFLVLDADTVVNGKVLDKIDNVEADFIVDKEVQAPEDFKTLYYDPEEIHKLFPGFTYPGYSFNSGQWIGTGNIFTKEHFDDLIIWDPSPRLKYPQYFKQADQGILNLLIHMMERDRKITVEKLPLMIWPERGDADFIELDSITEKKSNFPFIIHWAGMKFNDVREYPRADILQFYQKYFYSKYTFLEKRLDQWQDKWLKIEKKIKFRFLR